MYLDEPGPVGTKGAQMWTGGQKISAGVRYCPKVVRSALKCTGADPSMWGTAAAGSSRDPALAASAAVGEVCDISLVRVREVKIHLSSWETGCTRCTGLRSFPEFLRSAANNWPAKMCHGEKLSIKRHPQRHMPETKVDVVGRTGDGKSALCNLITRRLGMPHDVFAGSASVSSHTHTPVQCQVDGQSLVLVDTPGLMDSGGLSKDESNITAIVNDIRGGSYVNAFLLVINEQAPRFDAGMQDAVELLVDSFGVACLSHMGFVFTRATGLVSSEEAGQKATEFATIIANRCHASVNHMPHWQLDCHPEQLARMGASDACIVERQATVCAAVDELLRRARAKPQYELSSFHGIIAHLTVTM